MDFAGELKSKIVETLGLREVRSEDLTDDTFFFDDGLGLDSIDILELAVMIEEDYGVVIDNRELGEKVFITIGTLAKYILETRSEEAPSSL